MQNSLAKLLILLLTTLSLFASEGTTQKHLLSLSPAQEGDSARAKSLVKVTFDREIIKSSIKSKTITLKPINPKGKKVSANITVENKTTLLFTPDELLKDAEYRVKVNPIKLKAEKDDYQLSSFMKKLLYWLCSWFYDDISECPLYKKFYKAPSSIKTKTIKYTFTVVDRPEILNIKLNTTSLELNENETTQLNAVASYDDNTSKDVSKEVTWSIDNPQIASIDTNATLNATEEGTTQITATLENITSQILSLSVRKVINGHILPPMPDKTLNDSTLLGIDVNNNGVRDDVERLIIIEESKNPNFPKIHTALSLQYAWAWQKVIESPILELRKYLEDASACHEYFLNQHTKNMNFQDFRKWEKEHPSKLGVKRGDIIFNTKERIIQRFEFNKACSGNIFNLRKAEISACSIDIDSLGE